MTSKCPIIFGPLTKMLLIPFILALNQILYNIFILFFDYETSQIIESCSISFGHMLNAVIPHIKFFSTGGSGLVSKRIPLNPKKEEEEKKKQSKKWLFHYLLLGLIYLAELVLLGLPVMLSSDSESAKAIKLPHVIGPFSKESLIVVLLAIFSFFLLKYRYYIHNNISLVFFIIMGIIIDIILERFQEEIEQKTIGFIIVELAEIVVETINFCFQKYMIDVLYHNQYYVVFVLGLTLFLFQLVTVPQHFINEQLYEKLVHSFDNIGLLILKFIINMIFQFLYFLLRILTLANFTPTHLLICLSVSKFIVTLIQANKPIQYFSIIPFFFQFFSLMVYLEIIELNSCGLNKNTKRNIHQRGEEDMLERTNTMDSMNGQVIELRDGYFVDIVDKNNKETTEGNPSNDIQI